MSFLIEHWFSNKDLKKEKTSKRIGDGKIALVPIESSDAAHCKKSIKQTVKTRLFWSLNM
ncbi:hypothetical protein BpHYR1_005750 [Brachionus plicatilis]|uniref:Uncharacterized protein n=1 Tax=Brachionus plicatilis TaxID=10195 RepID=A0A3M7S283_BRAPC|nr:hypothetical protein BpHYR1_005750 [Brachionus plicatilis]